MTLHPPRLISSIEGLGLNTTKTMQRISDQVSIGTEVWNDLEKPWAEGETIIALPGYKWVTKWEVGKPYIITKYHDEKDALIAIYCDVTRPVKAIEGGFEFIDLYLDVWQIPGKEPIVLDEDELQDAIIAGYLNTGEAHKAERIAKEIIINIKNSPDFLNF
jgi:predicted RNA-binding protein associated with RNAse of E/G family